MGDVAERRGMTLLPAQQCAVRRGERLPGEIDAGRHGESRNMVFHRVEINGGAFEPAALADRLGHDKSGRSALEVLAVVLDENPTGLEKLRSRNTARLIE